MIFGQGLEAGGESDLAGKGQAGETDEFVVLDEHAVQRDPPMRRHVGGGIDRRAGLRYGIERDHNPLDRLRHFRASIPAALRVSSAAVAANASSRAAIR